MRQFSFNERKATQLASAFIERAGGSINHMKLIKLMYLADRAALLDWGRSITSDAYFSLPHGPVLSATLDLINEGEPPSGSSVWFEYIQKSGQYSVELIKSCNRDDLSTDEENLIAQIFDEYGHYGKWDLVDHLHDVLPEWEDPEGSSYPICIRDILQADGRSDADIKIIEAEIDAVDKAAALFGCD